MRAFQSENIDQLAAAMAAAQAELQDVVATETARVTSRTGSSFDYKYCDLASVRQTVLPVLVKHGLFVIQPMVPRDEGIMAERFCVLGHLRTVLMHSSGQWIAGEQPIAGDWCNAQAIGSAITYARRYGLAAICGVAQIDDDGQQATHRGYGRNGHANGSNGAPRSSTAPRSDVAPVDEVEPRDEGPEPGSAAYYRQNPDAARDFARQEIAQRFAPPGGAERRPPPQQQHARPDVTPATGPACPWPSFPKGGFYGWINDNHLNRHFTDLGKRANFPPRFSDWSSEQVDWACNEYEYDRANGHAAAATNGIVR